MVFGTVPLTLNLYFYFLKQHYTHLFACVNRYLEREGMLTPLVKRELLALLLEDRQQARTAPTSETAPVPLPAPASVRAPIGTRPPHVL